MSSDIVTGFTFYLRGHLHIVIGEISGPPEQILVVSLTTKREGSDPTVILQDGDHPFIAHDTVVNYSDSRIFNKDKLADGIEQKFFGIGKKFPKDKLTLVQNGLMKSPFTPNNIKDIYEKLVSK